ncbi:MAG: hypothetical protein EG823_09455 [Actinobacteria bacterium]|nr:hypothetical protein [Actinomycetota bacterium]
MLPGSSLYVLTILAVLGIVVLAGIRRMPYLRTLGWLAFAVYMTEVVSRTLFPLPTQARLIADMRIQQFGHHNFVPFRTMSSVLTRPDLSVALVQIGGNLLLFFPLGYFLPLLFSRMRRPRNALAALFAAIIGVEVVQLLLSAFVFGFVYKSFDADDILLNLCGGLLGYGLFRLCQPLIGRTSMDTPSSLTGSRVDDPGV